LEQLAGVDSRAALSEGRIDFLLGPAEIRNATVERARLYDDDLVYLRAGGAGRADAGPVRLDDIAGDTFLLVHARCGLTQRTHQLFRARHLALTPYRGEALSYQVLEEWASLGVGSAVLPRSKVSSADVGRPILLGNGRPAKIRFEAAWAPARMDPAHLAALAGHLRRTAAASPD